MHTATAMITHLQYKIVVDSIANVMMIILLWNVDTHRNNTTNINYVCIIINYIINIIRLINLILLFFSHAYIVLRVHISYCYKRSVIITFQSNGIWNLVI